MAKQTKTISLIVPVFNVNHFLDECVKSIINQTLKELEIILVDDGSTDGSAEKCDIWAKRDTRIKVIHHPNKGVSAARNIGLRNITGDYIGFIDADDYVSSHMYEVLLSLAEEQKADAVFSSYNEIRDNKIHEIHKNPVAYNDVKTAIKGCLEKDGWQLTIWNKLFKREVIYDAQGKMISFPEDLFIGEDAYWLLDVLLHCKRIAYTDKALYFYRQNRTGSAVANSFGEKRLSSCTSRFIASKRSYHLLKNAGQPYAWMMYRRCVFSAKDIACEKYLLSGPAEIKHELHQLYDCLTSYFKMQKTSRDLVFILKSMVLLILMQLHAPKKILKKVMKWQT